MVARRSGQPFTQAVSVHFNVWAAIVPRHACRLTIAALSPTDPALTRAPLGRGAAEGGDHAPSIQNPGDL